MPRVAYDIIVVGAGPSGSLAAYRLAAAGARVAIIDASQFPREKPCGGGLQQRSLVRIPFGLGPVLRGALNHLALSHGLGECRRLSYPEPLVYPVLRSEFDHYLLEAAIRVGAQFIPGVKVSAVRQDAADHAVVETDSGPLRSSFVVGADGANSVVSRILNKRSDYFWQAALYCEMPESAVNPESIDIATMRVDWGSLPSGYAWAFPKRGSVNVGVGCPIHMGKMLRPYLAKFLSVERIVRDGRIGSLRFRGHQLPTLTKRTRLAKGSVLLVGDAAGMVEPLTGDGISYACHSAQIAAEVIMQSLGQCRFDLANYEQRVRREIADDLVWAKRLMSLTVAFSRSIFGVVTRNEHVWETFCKVLRGDTSFQGLTRAVMGPLSAFRHPVRALVAHLERHRLRAQERILLDSLGES